MVRRHVNWVHSAAMRITHDSGLAEDVTQGVFLALAQKASQLAGHQSVASWLFRATQFGARTAIKQELRRKTHEAQAMTQAKTTMENDRYWEEIRGCLEDSVARLGRHDQEVILLRFYRQLTHSELASTLGIDEDAARKRVARALIRLRDRLGSGTPAILSTALLTRGVTAAPVSLISSISSGSHSLAAISICKGVKDMMRFARLKLTAMVLAVVLVPVLVCAAILLQTSDSPVPPGQPAPIVPVAASTPKLPFTISADTTRILEPLKPDGTVDYVAAINEKFSQGVTPENNGFVPWIQLMGVGALPPATANQLLQMTGVTAPTGGPTWRLFASQAELDQLPQGIWKTADHPSLTAWLKSHEPLLALATQAADKPRWWAPAVSKTGAMTWIQLSDLNPLRDVANALCQRALLRAGEGDFQGFLADVIAVKKLTRLASGYVTWSRLVTEQVDRSADQAIGAAACTGLFSSEQCAALGKAMDELPPLPTMWDAVDVGERWSELDTASLLATGHLDRWLGVNGPALDQKMKLLMVVDRDAVDWNVILRRINKVDDMQIQAMKQARMQDAMTSFFVAEHQIGSMFTSNHQHKSLAQEQGESDADYTQRVADAFMSTRASSFRGAEESYRVAQLHERMARALVAAAQYKAAHGQWPQKLEDLVPTYLPVVPIDIYSSGGDMPVRYLNNGSTIEIYSVGPNGPDDGRAHNDRAHSDDIAVGMKLNAIKGTQQMKP